MINFIMLTLLIIFLILDIYILIRNCFVYRFKKSLNDMCYLACKDHDRKIYENNNHEDFTNEHERVIGIWDSIVGISYGKMLFSFKPLKPKYWLNKEQLEFINN